MELGSDRTLLFLRMEIFVSRSLINPINLSLNNSFLTVHWVWSYGVFHECHAKDRPQFFPEVSILTLVCPPHPVQPHLTLLPSVRNTYAFCSKHAKSFHVQYRAWPGVIFLLLFQLLISFFIHATHVYWTPINHVQHCMRCWRTMWMEQVGWCPQKTFHGVCPCIYHLPPSFSIIMSFAPRDKIIFKI